MAPFAKGGGPKDRGIFASSRHFHKRRKDAKVSGNKFFSNLTPLRLGGNNPNPISIIPTLHNCITPILPILAVALRL